MAILKFPSVDKADENGLLAIGGDLEVKSLLLAYESGIFPWPISQEMPLAWFSPDPRGILEFDDFHVSKSFKKFLNKTSFTIEFNHNFEAVIMNCAMAKRKEQDGTWITDEIIGHYIDLFRKGYAYSAETYFEDNGYKRLVGGVYGVCISNFYSGESMYHVKDNASKFALYHLIQKLKSGGITWLDTQMVTPVVESIGGREIEREKFIEMLNKTNIHQRIVPNFL